MSDRVRAIWEDVLCCEVHEEQTLISLAGTSLQAMQILGRVQTEFGISVPVHLVFDTDLAAFTRIIAAAAHQGAKTADSSPIGERFRAPLSPAQQRLWFVDKMFPGRADYNVALAFRVTGALDTHVLAEALTDLTEAHPVLRIAITDSAAGPTQQVRRTAPIALHAEPVDEADVTAIVRDEARAPFDLTGGPLFRVRLLRTAADHILLLSFHHVVTDRHSTRILLRDLARYYDLRRRGTPPPPVAPGPGYLDYALRHRDLFDVHDREAELDFWTRLLPHGLRPFEMIAAGDVLVDDGDESGRLRVVVPAHLRHRLTALARQHNATLFMTLLAAWELLVTRLSGQYEGTMTVPVAGRLDPDWEDTVGLFASPLVWPITVVPEQSFIALLGHVRQTAMAVYAHQELPVEQVVAHFGSARSVQRDPLAAIKFTLEEGAAAVLDLPDLRVETLEVETGIGRFDLGMEMEDIDGTLTATLTWRHGRYTNDTAQSILHRYLQVLECVVAQPDRAVIDFDLLTEQERVAILARSRGPLRAAGCPVPTRVADLIDRAPHQVAVVAHSARLTYAELDAYADRVAAWLTGVGVGRGDRVALRLPASVWLPCAALGVWRIGAAYVPIDPEWPDERTAWVLTDSGARALITAGEEPEIEWQGPVAAVVDLPGVDNQIRRHTPIPLDLAYVIYTSGTTGRPKGVMVEHKSLANLVHWAGERLSITPWDRCALVFATSFDPSVLDMWAALSHGATLHIAEPEHRRDPGLLCSWLGDQRITLVGVPTGLAEALLALPRSATMDLRILCTAGDRLHWDSDATVPFEVVNAYGPTETTIYATAAPVRRRADHRAPPIGRPLNNLDAHVLDARLRAVPDGTVGELYLAGPAVARGYLGQAGRTAERFVADPFGAGRMYRTGDLVRWLADGQLEFIGRSDQQIKVRGRRIEPQEVETAMREHPTVAHAVVIGRGTRLLGYFVPADGEVTDVQDDIARRLRARLPAYLLPDQLIPIPALPLTANGKVDRRALPQPRHTGARYVTPVGTERRIAATFAEILGCGSVGAGDDFFALGGDSLAAARVVAVLEHALGRQVLVRTLFEAPVVAELAERIDTDRAAAIPASVASQRLDRVPLAPVQQRMWLMNRVDPQSPAYNVAVALGFSGPLDRAALTAALGDVIARHEPLRTRYPEADGTGYQLIVDADAVSPHLEPVAIALDQLEPAMAAVIAVPFDVTTAVPLRVHLFRTDTESHVLLLVAHHIAVDGFAATTLTQDLLAAYAARARGTEPDWSPLTIHYADYASWLRRRLGAEDDPQSMLSQQLRYWSGALAGAPDCLPLPTDRPRPADSLGAAAMVTRSVRPEVSQAVEQLARARRMTPFMMIHAALAVLLARLSGVSDVVIGTPVAGRGSTRLDHLVGMFVNTLALRTEVRREDTFGELLDRIRSTDLGAFGHAEVPFDRVVEEIGPSREGGRHPIFQVLLAFTSPARELSATGLEVRRLELDPVAAQFDLTVTVTTDARGTTVGFCYATALFDSPKIEAMAERLETILSTIIADPETVVGDIDIRTRAERAQITFAPASAAPATMGEILARGAAVDPDSLAVIADGKHLTYRDLDAWSDRIAHELIGLGATPEKLVAIGITRSLESVAAVWAVAKTGAAFVPVDPAHPELRVARILELSGARLGVTTSEHRARFPHSVRWVEIDSSRTDSAADAISVTALRAPTARPDNAAYMIFTSGSTGESKGVVVTHTGLAGLIAAARDRYGVTAESRVLHVCSPNFDVSVLELVLTASVGATLVVSPPHVFGGFELSELIRRTRVSHVFITPWALSTAGSTGLDDLEVVVVAGDRFGPELVAEWAVSGRRFYNGYGPTEATILATGTDALSPQQPITIGTALPGIGVHVLDDRLQPVAEGVVGELYLSGSALARAYAGRADLTACRFVACPDPADGERMYRTGDMVRWRHGELEYVGRTDHQVKLSGVRIELAEVEAALLSQPQVAQAVAVIRDDPRRGPLLVAYVVVDRAEPPGAQEKHRRRGRDTTELRAAIARHLPAYMVPAALVEVDRFPLTRNGKLDRQALPAPPSRGDHRVCKPPRTATEHAVTAGFEEILANAPVGVNDNFFDLGGTSTAAVRLVSRLRERTGLAFPVQWVFADPTPAGLAARITGSAMSGHADDALRTVLPIRATGRRTPLFCIHPAIGLCWGYTGLVRHLDERPIYGLQSPFLTDTDTAADDLGYLVDVYLEAIRGVRPHGPYLLLGYSAGGPIAHALAVELRRCGEHVAGLIMLDSRAGDLRELPDEREIYRLVLSELDGAAPGGVAPERGRRSEGGSASALRGIERAYRDVLTRLSAHTPEIFDGDLLFFSADHADDGRSPNIATWRSHVGGQIIEHRVGFDHRRLLSVAALQVIGPVVAEYVRTVNADI
ncbi:amino acid adenylation domain-containing protein [Nocardia sp. NPDC050793]|uniref:amino acid adenylation domain-containing protein n=1 Tax=Nocardia sp. NPDC050793 TaxID=3155159 RepID=UPI0033E2E6E7